MDKKSITILVVCLGLFVAMNSLVPKLFPPIPRPAVPTNAVAAAGAPGQTNMGAQISAPTASISASTTPVFAVAPDVPEELVVLKNENARYTFTSHGGGLKLVELVHYPETVSRIRGKTETNRFATLNTLAPVPVLAIAGEGLQEDGVFKLTQRGSTVRAEKSLTNGLVIVKEFRLGTNYLVEATVRIENTTTETLTLPEREIVIGTATPMSAQDDGVLVGISWYDGKAMQSVSGSHFSSSGVMCTPRIPPREYRAGQSNVVWAAVHNQFFTLVAMPTEPAGEVVTRTNILPAFPVSPAMKSAPVRPVTGFQTALVYPQATLAAKENFERRIFLFAGPKEYQTLARIGTRFQNNLDQVLGFDQMFPFYSMGGFFAKALLLAMNTLHNVLHVGYGWAIIIITIIIKVVFWPLTRASTRSMKRLQALQPQMAAIKEKYKDDPLKAQKKTMEFMKENKVSPLGGCLPMLVQIPVFIAFFTMIRSAIELRGASFLWVGDLSMSDTLFIIPGLTFIPMISIPGVGLPFNLLPLLMGATMLWQSHVTPQSPSMDPMQQKIMKYMPLIFLVFLYNFSAGLTLYWTVQNLLTIVQMKLTKAEPAAVSTVAKPKK